MRTDVAIKVELHPEAEVVILVLAFFFPMKICEIVLFLYLFLFSLDGKFLNRDVLLSEPVLDKL